PVLDSFTINVTDNAPTVESNLPATVAEGGTTTIGDGVGDDGTLSAPNEVATEVLYTLTVLPRNGTLYRDGVALGAGSTFTQDDIDNGRISYTNDASLPDVFPDSFTFTVQDGAGSNALQNGGFEDNGGVDSSTFAGWTTGSLGGAGWFAQTGTGSPIF